MKRCVIVGGADIGVYDYLKTVFKEDDFFIYCDSGIKHKDMLGREPDLLIGDFDSHENPMLSCETIILPCEKDDTDTVYAVKQALDRGFDEFLLVGVVGGRLDHTIGNLSILLRLDSLGKKAVMFDDYSSMSIISGETAYVEDDCRFFSLLNITGKAEGITIKNAKYQVEDASIDCEYQYGVSNEVNPGGIAEVSVKEGRLLLIKVFKDKHEFDGKLLCPCCRAHRFEEKNAFEICPVCGWEDDPLQRKDPDFAGGANKLSLNDFRKEFLNKQRQ